MGPAQGSGGRAVKLEFAALAPAAEERLVVQSVRFAAWQFRMTWILIERRLSRKGQANRFKNLDHIQPRKRLEITNPYHSATACSSKGTVRLINGIAPDECRARERYPARRPFYFSPPSTCGSKGFANGGIKPATATGRRWPISACKH